MAGFFSSSQFCITARADWSPGSTVVAVRMNSKWGRNGMTSITVRPGRTQTEEELVRSRGLDYARFTVDPGKHDIVVTAPHVSQRQ